ncbi:MAG: M48 family metallopeptidase, partial [Nitrospinaceae bacterium]
ILIALGVLPGCTTTPVSGRQALILVPFSQEMALGRQAFAEVLKKEKESEDAKLRDIVERVGRRIAAVSEMPQLPWEFKLIESKQQNAFALPGGKTAVYTGILPVCANEAGLAAVIGHEVAHVIARHGAQRMSQNLLIGVGMTAAAVSLSKSDQRGAILGALGLGATLGLTLPFSRGMEAEADEIGLIYMARAGYDPMEAERFWSRFAKIKQGPKPPEFLSTHPADSTRINRIRQFLPRARAVYQRNPNKFGLGESFLVALNRDKLPGSSTADSKTPEAAAPPAPPPSPQIAEKKNAQPAKKPASGASPSSSSRPVAHADPAP